MNSLLKDLKKEVISEMRPVKLNGQETVFITDDGILTSLIPDLDNEGDETIGHNIVIHHSNYAIKKESEDKKVYYHFLSDCVFQFLYRLNDEEGTHLVKIQQEIIKNKPNRVELLELKSSELSLMELTKRLYKRGFSFIGTADNLKRIIKYNLQREKEAIIIETLGFQPEYNIFATSEAIIDIETNNVLYPNSIGIVDCENNSFYLPESSPANKNKDSISMKYRVGTLDFKGFSKLYYDAYDQKAMVGIMFYINSLFRDIVFKNLDFFPIEYLYGEASTGKTTFTNFRLALFGSYSEGEPLKSITQPGITRIANQKRNAMVYLKEYDRDCPPYVEDYMKTAYDGQARTIATGIGNKTLRFDVLSSCIVDSNYLPTNDIAIFTRNIIIDFEKSGFTDKQSKACKELIDHRETGLCQITKEMLNHRQLFQREFKTVYFDLLNRLKKGRKGKQKGILKYFEFTDERMNKHIAFILTPYLILNDVIEFPFSFYSLVRNVLNIANVQNEKLKANKSTNKFWQALSIAKQERQLMEFTGNKDIDKSYLHYRKDTDEQVILLKTSKMSDLYKFYTRLCKNEGLKMDNLSELESKLISQNYEPFIRCTQGSRKKSKAFTDYHLSSAYKFKYTIENGIMFIDNQEVEL
jgi:hypothetical protein